MRQRLISHMAKYIFVVVILSVKTVLSVLFIKSPSIWGKALIIFILIVFSKECFTEIYFDYVMLTRNKSKRKMLNMEEKEIIKEAVELIRKVDENIEIARFNVYKVKYVGIGAKFSYDLDTDELNIFIPFDKVLKRNRDLCFLIVVHELLHSQNLKRNEKIFENDFLEGLNEFLTIWLIENYTKKDKKSFITYKTNFFIRIPANNYKKEMKKVESIIKNSKKDIREIYFNYINLNPEFFRNWVPKEYLLRTTI